jgi:hypothetical protein
MTRWAAFLSMAILAACASSGAAPARETSGPVEGTYDYVAMLPGQQVQGQLRVLGDTIIIIPNNDYCRPFQGPPSPLVIRYTCNGPGSFESLSLTLDRRNPVQFSKWAASYRVQKQRQVCRRYVTQPDGRQTCAEWGSEPYEATESRSGSLQVRRAP